VVADRAPPVFQVVIVLRQGNVTKELLRADVDSFISLSEGGDAGEFVFEG
jgi:hypothetical protein